ncbi:MAG: proton-translocating NADH-quinone oxidoreductase chain L, partial [bacterium]
MDLIWLIPILPLLGFLINGLLARRFNFSEKLVGGVAVATVFLAFVLSITAFVNYSAWSKQPENQAKPYISKTLNYTWISGGKAFISSNTTSTTSENSLVDLKVQWAYQIDHLSVLYALFVTFVGLLIHIFAIGYMHGQ